MALIDRYIARSILTPLGGSLAIAFVVLAIEELARLMNALAKTGAGLFYIWKMLAFLLPGYLALAIPISLLLGVFIAFRQLALSRELDALGGIGLGFERLLRIPMGLAVAMSFVALAINGFAEPLASYQFDQLGFRLDSGAIGASIKVGEFVPLGKSAVLRIERSEEHGRHLIGIFFSREASGESVAVSAASGRFLASGSTLLLRLSNGRLVQTSAKFRSPRALIFTSYDLPLGLPPVGEFRARGAKSSELTLPELLGRSTDPRSSQSDRRRALGDFNARFARSTLILLLPLLAISLAVPTRRSSSSSGAIVGILVVVAFEKVCQEAVALGAAGTLDPLVAVWLPFLVFSGLILRVYWLVTRRPGGWSMLEFHLPAAAERMTRRLAARWQAS